MKQTLVLILLIAFNVGAVTSSAFAFSCPMLSGITVEAETNGEMPCHNEQEQQQQKHQQCDGPCLCLHLSVNQAQILDNASPLPAIKIMSEASATGDSQVHSLPPPPLFKPPIAIS